MALQTDFTARQQAFFVGFPTMPFADCFTRRGRIYVPDMGTAPKPGDAVVWNDTQKSWALPTTAAESAGVRGVLVLSQQTTGVEYENEDPVIVLQRGNLAVIAGGTVAFDDFVQWQTGDQKWDSYDHEIDVADRTGTVNLANLNGTKDAIETAVNAALLVSTGIRCASYNGAADDGIMEITVNLV